MTHAGACAAALRSRSRRVNADPSGLAFDVPGDLFIASGPFAEVVRVRAADLNPAKPGVAQPIARNSSAGPLEFPAAVVFVGDRAYVPNVDVPRRANLDASGTTARDGVGASIVVITP